MSEWLKVKREMMQYEIGWAAYAEGKPLSECRNDEQRRGWLAANRAQGHADATAYMMAVTV